jgi:amino acid transporter
VNHGENRSGTDSGISGKGLRAGSIGLIGATVIGISCIAPAYTLTASVGPTAEAVGTQIPGIYLVGFLPMLLVALAYRELNNAMPDSGTSFTWATRAFGPWIGWMGGWGLVVATVVVLSNLAGVAVDFFYLMLSQVSGVQSIAGLADNKLINIATCLCFMSGACFVSYRGMEATKGLQYVLVAFQLIVMVWFSLSALGHAMNAVPGTGLTFHLSWLNPFEVKDFSVFAAGVSLSIFVFWGWDVTLTMNEETKNPKKTPGRAATLTACTIFALYILVSVSMLMFAGTGKTGLGLCNEEIRGNVFAPLAGPVLGPFAILMSLAVLSSSAASLQSTIVGPARTMLAMGHYRAFPRIFSSVSQRFKSPSIATITAAGVAGGFYAVMHLISKDVLTDTILTLGMMICFYYGITAFACLWYFRGEWFSGIRPFFYKLLAPLFGGGILTAIFVRTILDSMNPQYGSGSQIGGIGLVFILGVLLLIGGVALMLLMWFLDPVFFRGETIRTASSVEDRKWA